MLLMAGVLLSACSTNIGEAPRPDVPSAHLPYPAVNDMPPPRANTTLTASEQQQVEKDILSAGDAATNRARQKPPAAGGADTTSKKAVKSDQPTAQAGGSGRNP
jgi:hypothetical protein